MTTSEKKLIELLKIPVANNNIKINDKSIHFIKAGQGDVVVLIHGLNFGWGAWYKTIPVLARHFTVFALDLPGAGSSGRIDFSTANIGEVLLDVVRQFIQTLKLKPAMIVGHSLGGWITLRLALEKNLTIKKIAVVDSMGFSDYLVWKQRPLVFNGISNLLSKSVMTPTIKHMTRFLSGVFLNPSKAPLELVSYYTEAISAPPISHPFYLIHRLVAPFHIRKEFILANELKNILIPTAIFSGDSDPLLPLSYNQKYFSKIPEQKTYIVPQSGHVPQIENPEFFNSRLLSFLQL